ncbi:unnamed protein product [Oppiella nova]|uniref:Carboxylesterase type B domain-containing protein n=1 Tax=Oppiella nova TaxID=334625 RepID=A0A7R9QVU9_9ACAR|nr:unnamed protein product [Oppiella nova]CAG2176930.1 unnamed protein product [Oppiella nova]
MTMAHNIVPKTVGDYYLRDIDLKNSDEMLHKFLKLLTDLLVVCPTYTFAKRFAKRARVIGCSDRHMCHGSSSQYIYGQPIKTPKLFAKKDYDFSLDVMRMWTNFAKNGYEMWL